MCIEFMDLNKAYQKDKYHLTCIDSLVDVVARLEMMSVLDCYSRYH